MGLINKLKNILFEEEEVEIPVIEKKTEIKEQPVYKEMPKKEVAPVKSSFYDDLEPVIKQENNMEAQNREKVKTSSMTSEVSEREIFKSEKTFNFPAFDEEEFESMTPRTTQRSTNIMEHERKMEAKRQEYKRPERKEEKPAQPKFKPSPIISPVYGILDKNYTPDEITSRTDNTLGRKLDVDSVRKKAFGEPQVVQKEEVVVSEQTMDDKILEEKLEKARTIDELLKDTSDEVIDLNDIPEATFEDLDKEEEVIDTPEEEVLEDIEPKHEASEEDDTLESDLFDLIDSMYENREDGE